MPTRNYVFGARAPVTLLPEVEKQFSLMHAYRNRLVEAERDRRAQAEKAVVGHFPDLVRLKAEAEEAQRCTTAAADEIREINRVASAEAGHEQGRRARPTIDAPAAMKDRFAELSRRSKALWKEYDAARKAAYKSKRAQKDLARLTKEHQVLLKTLRAESDLYWGNYLVVEEAAKNFGKGPPPEFESWLMVHRHRVAVQLQSEIVGHKTVRVRSAKMGKMVTRKEAIKEPGISPSRLASGADTRLRTEPAPPPPGQVDGSRRSRRRHLILSFRIGTTEDNEPKFARVPILMHRPLPEDGRIKWAFLFRDRVGLTFRWSVMFTVVSPDRDRRFPDSARDGTVAVAFKVERRDDGGIRVATWKGLDGRSGEIVLPAVSVEGGEREGGGRAFVGGRFDESSRLRSWIDVVTNVTTEAVSNWLVGVDSVLPEFPLEREQGQPSGTVITGLVGAVPAAFLDHFVRAEAEHPSVAQVAAWVKAWRSPERLLRLYLFWAGHRVPGDDDVFALLTQWYGRYEHLENWRAHGAAQHAAWRTDLYRKAAVHLRRQYQTAVLVQAGEGDEIVNPPQLKVEDGPRRLDPDNGAKRVASTGLLRRLMTEAFEVPLALPASLGETAEIALANRARAVPALVVRAKRVRKKPKTAPAGG